MLTAGPNRGLPAQSGLGPEDTNPTVTEQLPGPQPPGFAFEAPSGERRPRFQYALPRAETGQSVSTLPLLIPTYQSWTLQVGSQCPGTSRSFSLIFRTPLGSSMTPCSSEHLTYFTSSRP